MSKFLSKFKKLLSIVKLSEPLNKFFLNQWELFKCVKFY